MDGRRGTACAAVFLDRDGVLIPDDGLMAESGNLRLLDGVPDALTKLSLAGFELVVISNQPIVARGLAAEDEVKAVNDTIRSRIELEGGPRLDHFYICPHHPRANLERYRLECECRKPKPGLLRLAAEELSLKLGSSFMIGDRMTDVIAGAAAGCRTILVESGRHLDPPIETSVEIDPSIEPDFICADLAAATTWILAQ